MNRLDLLRKANTVQKDKPTKPTNSRSSMLDSKNQQQKKDTIPDELISDDFTNDINQSTEEASLEHDDINQNNINIIEIDINDNHDINLKDHLFDDTDGETDKELELDNKQTSKDIDHEMPEIVEGRSDVDYSDDDIKIELDYVFNYREDVYHSYIKAIKNGGIEINTPKILHLDDIVRVSVTLSELKEQVGCEARVISAFPYNIFQTGKNNSNEYRYIVQFIGPNASETDRVISKYLLGYKIK
ncbi:PilZ domain-containing protein [Allofrancisella guangzhouensis]|uniref:PilZ domain-containing protein n=1 Tax=Allofrancisella guangzhouensis TaxID=594679 RepID=A0A0A8E7Q0_9GAMM|nr:PilZ domain-containing protein [Allofrancisella guangzhouensis]AJC48171.1 hypothetical protein SD28_00085 [Allofrancisella guangzhouensis]MBK2027037.1 PilZ domain-containing protein [Allofrancisella guangzhouensis]MBK2044527.1 PilZ domain-containing protein [Allofrancisella guangzhouensis]MBK2046141.1 PilZ domain-containing protein [Allofrancisella guangzhouensis]